MKPSQISPTYERASLLSNDEVISPYATIDEANERAAPTGAKMLKKSSNATAANSISSTLLSEKKVTDKKYNTTSIIQYSAALSLVAVAAVLIALGLTEFGCHKLANINSEYATIAYIGAGCSALLIAYLICPSPSSSQPSTSSARQGLGDDIKRVLRAAIILGAILLISGIALPHLASLSSNVSIPMLTLGSLGAFATWICYLKNETIKKYASPLFLVTLSVAVLGALALSSSSSLIDMGTGYLPATLLGVGAALVAIGCFNKVKKYLGDFVNFVIELMKSKVGNNKTEPTAPNETTAANKKIGFWVIATIVLGVIPIALAILQFQGVQIQGHPILSNDLVAYELCGFGVASLLLGILILNTLHKYKRILKPITEDTPPVRTNTLPETQQPPASALVQNNPQLRLHNSNPEESDSEDDVTVSNSFIPHSTQDNRKSPFLHKPKEDEVDPWSEPIFG